MEVHEVPDFMRALGNFLSDYEIECLQHELQIGGRRRIPFEELLKLFVNHSKPLAIEAHEKSLEESLKNLLGPPAKEDDVVTKSQLVAILTESAEKVDEKDALSYLKELLRNRNGKAIEEISLSDFAMLFMKDISNDN